MTEVQIKYLQWVGYNDFEIEEVETEIKNGEEPLIFESNKKIPRILPGLFVLTRVLIRLTQFFELEINLTR